MQASDLDLRELLQFEPDGDFVRFAGQRALLLDTVALGILRRELIREIGGTGARGVLTRFGYAHGWRAAASIRELLPKGDQAEWQRMGARPREDWGEAYGPQLGYFQATCLNSALAEVAAELKRVEQALHDHRLQVGPEGAAALGP